MSYINNFFIKFFCKKVGEDFYFNKYYESKRLDYLGRSKRFVIYDSKNEAAKIATVWHAWLHRLVDDLPPNKGNIIEQKFMSLPSKVTLKYQRWKP